MTHFGKTVLAYIVFGGLLVGTLWLGIQGHADECLRLSIAAYVGVGITSVVLVAAAFLLQGGRVYGETANALGITGLQISIMASAFASELEKAGQSSDALTRGTAAFAGTTLILSGFMFGGLGLASFKKLCSEDGGRPAKSTRRFACGVMLTFAILVGAVFIGLFVSMGRGDIRITTVLTVAFFGFAALALTGWFLYGRSRDLIDTWVNDFPDAFVGFILWSTLVAAGVVALVANGATHGWGDVYNGLTLLTLGAWFAGEILVFAKWHRLRRRRDILEIDQAAYFLDALLAVLKCIAIVLMIVAVFLTLLDRNGYALMFNTLAVVSAGFGVYARLGYGLLKMRIRSEQDPAIGAADPELQVELKDFARARKRREQHDGVGREASRDKSTHRKSKRQSSNRHASGQGDRW